MLQKRKYYERAIFLKEILVFQISVFILTFVTIQNHEISAQFLLTDTIYFTKQWKETSITDSIAFYRVISFDKNGTITGKVRDFYGSGQKQWQGYLLSTNPDVFDGECTWYDESGNEIATVCYDNGKVNTELADELWAQAKSFSEKGHYSKALEFYISSAQAETKCAAPRVSDLAATYSWTGVCYDNMANYDSALFFYKKAFQLYRQLNLQIDMAREGTNIGYIYYIKEEYDSTLVYYFNTLGIYEKSADKNRELKLLQLIGNTYYFMERYNPALKYYNKALEIDELYGDSLKLSRVYNDIGNVYNSLARYPEAIQSHTKAMQLLKYMPPNSELSRSYNNIGTIYYEIGKYDSAQYFFNAALAISRSMGNKLDESYQLTNLGTVYEAIGKYDSAFIFHHKALEIKKLYNDKQSIASSYSWIASLYVNQGDYDKAINNYKIALDLSKEQNNKKAISTTYNNIGLVYKHWGSYDNALEYYYKALDIDSSYNFITNLATDYNNIGAVFQEQQMFDEALRYFKLALSMNEKIGNPENTAVVLNNIGLLLIKLRQYDEALDYFTHAIKIYDEIGNVAQKPTCLNNIGLCYYQLQDYPMALEYYNSALSINKRLDHSSSMALDYENIGQVHWQNGDYNNSIKCFKKSIDLIEKVRLTATGSLRRDYFSTQNNVYKCLVHTYMCRNDFGNALRATEISTAKYLYEQLLEKSTGNYDEILTEQNFKLSKNSAAVKFANIDWENSIRLVISKDSISGRMVSNKTYLDEIRSALNMSVDKEEVGAVEFRGASNDRGYARLELNSANTINFEQIIYGFRELLVKSSFSSEEQEKFQTISQLLYQFLFAQIQDQINDKNELILLPEGALGFLPFEALIMPNGKYLCEKYSIRYAQSLSVLQLLENRKSKCYRQRRSSRQRLLSMGGAVYNDETYMAEMEPALLSLKNDYPVLNNKELWKTLDRMNRGNWGNLPGTLEEVYAMRNYFRYNTILTDYEATETNLKELDQSGKLQKFDVIHFATHGTVVPQMPELSALILSLYNDSLNDGYLRMKEIAQLNICADFVNLSACETGLGKIYGGEGVVGLTQSWLLAGANGISVSLWKVSDIATKQFMVSLYEKATAGGIPYHEAIHQTKQEFISGKFGGKYTHPYYWAPFVYYGR